MIHTKPNFNFSQNLRLLMEKRRIRFSDLAQKVSVPKSTIHRWMYGDQPRDLVALKKIADYFSISVDEICFGNLSPKVENIQNDCLSENNTEGFNIGSFDVILLRRRI